MFLLLNRVALSLVPASFSSEFSLTSTIGRAGSGKSGLMALCDEGGGADGVAVGPELSYPAQATNTNCCHYQQIN